MITALDYSPDGRLLAVSGYHEVLLHTADGSALVGRLVGLSERIESAAFSPDGKRLAVAGGSPARLGEVQIWDVEKQELKLSVTSHVRHDLRRKLVARRQEGRLRLRRQHGAGDRGRDRPAGAVSGRPQRLGARHGLLDRPSHLISVSRDRSMKLTEVATQRFVDNITSITPGALKGGLMAVDRHPTKEELVVGGADGEPKLFRMYRVTGKARKIGDDFNLIRNFEPMPGRIFAVEFSRDGIADRRRQQQRRHRAKCAFTRRTTPSWSRSSTASRGRSTPRRFSPDGSAIAAGGFDGKVLLIDAADGKLIKEFVPVPLDQWSVGSGRVVSEYERTKDEGIATGQNHELCTFACVSIGVIAVTAVDWLRADDPAVVTADERGRPCRNRCRPAPSS